MYDNVRCEYPLPCPEVQGEVFQTKDFNMPCLDDYRITKEGRLILRLVRWESVPEQERPYWGKPEWEKNGIFRVCGSIKDMELGEQDVNYHGDLHFYTSGKNGEWYEFVARFTHGTVEWIKRVPKCSQCHEQMWHAGNNQYRCPKCKILMTL